MKIILGASQKIDAMTLLVDGNVFAFFASDSPFSFRFLTVSSFQVQNDGTMVYPLLLLK